MEQSLFEKLMVNKVVKKYPALFGTCSLLLCSQEPTTGLCFESNWVHNILLCFFKIQFNTVFPS
jgi:hypothetical protein